MEMNDPKWAMQDGVVKLLGLGFALVSGKVDLLELGSAIALLLDGQRPPHVEVD